MCSLPDLPLLFLPIVDTQSNIDLELDGSETFSCELRSPVSDSSGSEFLDKLMPNSKPIFGLLEGRSSPVFGLFTDFSVNNSISTPESTSNLGCAA